MKVVFTIVGTLFMTACVASATSSADVNSVATAPATNDSTSGSNGVAVCAAVSVDREKLAQAKTWIAGNTNYIDSFLVQHCGEILVEKYYRGFDASKRHQLQSATKTFTGALIGVALKQGVIENLDQPILELLPDYAHLLTGAKAQITLRHLLTMMSGLKWVDFGAGSSFDRMAAASDSVAFILGEPMVSEPGETFFYNTGSSHLLSAIIHHNTGMTIAQYAEKNLFGPLGIEDYEWRAHPDGINQGGWRLFLRPLDMVKFGQLYLDEGAWNGEQVIGADYIAEATAFHVQTYYGNGYGFQMWIDTDFGTKDVASARGWGGQVIFVLDELGTVVTFNGSIEHPQEMRRDVVMLIKEFVIPAHTISERGRVSD